VIDPDENGWVILLQGVLGFLGCIALFAALAAAGYGIHALTGWPPADDPAMQEQIDQNCPMQGNAFC
jgi:hypothetical protein